MAGKGPTGAGIQHTNRGPVQGTQLVGHPSGQPIDTVVDTNGKLRLLVDAALSLSSVTVNVDLDSSTDNVAIQNTGNSNELLIESDGTISIRLLDETGSAFTNANPLPVEIAAGIELNVQLDAVTSGDSVRAYGVDGGATQRQVLLDTAGRTLVAQPTHDNLNLNANLQILDADATTLNPVPVAIISGGAGGTLDDTVSNGAGDGLIALTGGTDVLFTKAIPSGTTYVLSSWNWASNKQVSFKLEVRDGAVLVETIRATVTTPGDANGEITFPETKQIVGAATRSIRATAFRITGTGGFAHSAINGRTVP